MGIISADKIFIDPKEEINFIIERILKSQKDNIIIVVPQNSILLSSPISINILFKEISKTSKNSIIVTEDTYGTSIAQKAGFIVVKKVSQVGEQDWDQALNRKIRYRDAQERRKNELLSDIGLIESNDEVQEKNQTIEKNEIIEIDEEPIKMFEKPRKDSKVIELGGIKLATAGDIRALSETKEENEILSPRNEFVNDIPEREIKSISTRNFAGKDFTKNFTDRRIDMQAKKSGTILGDDQISKKKRNRKIAIISVISILIFLLGSIILIAFQFSSIDINLKFKQEEVSGTADVILDPDITEVVNSPAKIPSKILKEEGLNISKAGEATGESIKGTKSKGFVTIYNLTDSVINLKQGTVLTNTVTSKKYVILQDVNLKVAVPGVNPYVENVSIEATEFGSDFNIPISPDSVSLEVTGYSAEFASKRIYARVFNEISGGTSEKFKSVSQDNIDKLKENLKKELETQGLGKIRTSIPTGFSLVSETLEFTETKLSSLPKLNEESKDGKFNLSLEGFVTVIAVANNDLKKIAEFTLFNNEGNSNENTVVGTVQLPTITTVKKEDKIYKITISTQGSVGVRPTEETMKREMSGKSIAEANEYLKTLPNIENVQINFSPSFIPDFLRRIPAETSRINIRIK